jgi:hypothetical protein
LFGLRFLRRLPASFSICLAASSAAFLASAALIASA